MSRHSYSHSRLGACGGTKSALSRGRVNLPRLGTHLVLTKLVSSCTKLYQVVSSQGASGTKWGPSRDQVRTLTPRLEASLKTVVVATRIGLGQGRLNGGAA